LGGLGFLGRGIFRAGFGGGPIGCSSATIGLGSILTDPFEVQSPGTRITCAGTVAGWNLSIAKLTVKSLPSGVGMLTVQGVLQPGPREVRASAPGGVDTS
jgi:hypothetical protein